MAAFRRSLAEDSIDRYNHTFSFGLLLLLALVSWLLPLSPHLQQGGSTGTEGHVTSPAPRPEYTANCWCPQEFTGSMVNYANVVCLSNFLHAINGNNETDLSGGIYHPVMDQVLPIDRADLEFKPAARKRQHSPSNQQAKDQESVSNEEKQRQERYDGAFRFMRVTTPLSLFLLALLVKAPQVLCSLLAGALGALNVDQTLSADRASRRELRQHLGEQSGRAAGGLYLLLKLLACVGALLAVVLVHAVLVPRAANLNHDLSPAPPSQADTNTNPLADGTSSDSEEEADYDLGILLLCDFDIRMLSNVRAFTLQCMFSRADGPANEYQPEKRVSSQPSSSSGPAPVACELYEALFLVVQASLIALVVLNIFSFILWAARLLALPCRKFVPGGGDQLPLDAIFLLHMARENAGPEVFSDFAHGGIWSDRGKGGESMPLQE